MKNRYEKRSDHYVIFANGGGMQNEILVDEEDFETVAAFSGTWCVRKDRYAFYAQIWVRRANGKQKNANMHRLLLNPPAHMQVDHRNHNGLDNRRQNIRIVTRGENGRNRIDNVEFQSDVDGVRWDERAKAWRAHPGVNGKKEHLGLFDTLLEAEAAVTMFLETSLRVKRTLPTAEFQSNVPGVTWNAQRKAWRAHPWLSDKLVYLGLYDTIPEAHAALLMYQETGLRVKRSRKRKQSA